MSRESHDTLSTADLIPGAHHERDPHRDQVMDRGLDRDPARDAPQARDMGWQDPQAQRQQPAMQPRQPMEQPLQHPMQEPALQQPPTAEAPQAAHRDPVEQLAALFPPQVAADFRDRWDQVQIGFVDDPRRAVQQADELVAEVMATLASSFSEQRAQLEGGVSAGGQANTEHLRMALRSYRSFFQRLLAL